MILLSETHVISLREAAVEDSGGIVCFQMMPAWVQSSIPGTRPKDYGWDEEITFVYRHEKPANEEESLTSGPLAIERGIVFKKFDQPPIFKLLWTESGQSVALYLNGEPWAFIYEGNRKGYSKGVLPPIGYLSAVGNLWDQELFERLFKS